MALPTELHSRRLLVVAVRLRGWTTTIVGANPKWLRQPHPEPNARLNFGDWGAIMICHKRRDAESRAVSEMQKQFADLQKQNSELKTELSDVRRHLRRLEDRVPHVNKLGPKDVAQALGAAVGFAGLMAVLIFLMLLDDESFINWETAAFWGAALVAISVTVQNALLLLDAWRMKSPEGWVRSVVFGTATVGAILVVFG
ncbi:bZIP transcription factor [Curtobacterium flaccumfaciens]|uniref:bZIP transcription factor n=1 Tax=Curtobacterium flaccumfaciens TaxID=2035 RepID=UPI001BDE6E31|nr:bZIP transcription factor [Curtobacterium flaccumfaciens]MBT1630436.1 bZIP transcription factor [Curtobacterium flaccumfaciens pv. oortii]MCX2843916.1 bZIP transcription factor [Curtobacterium flaccumfaciens pv. oortii]